MTKYFYIAFFGSLGEDEIALTFNDVTRDIFFLNDQSAILKSDKDILGIKDEANITNPDAPEFMIIEITSLNSLQIYCEDNPEFERFLDEVTSGTPTQEEIDCVLDKLFKYGAEKLTSWDYRVLDYRSQVVGS